VHFESSFAGQRQDRSGKEAGSTQEQYHIMERLERCFGYVSELCKLPDMQVPKGEAALDSSALAFEWTQPISLHHTLVLQ